MGEADVRLDGIQEDIRGIRADMAEMRALLATVAIQGEKLASVEREIRELRGGHERHAGEIRQIRETCISRESLIRAGERHLEEDVSADTYWARLVASGATAGVWILAGAVVSALVARWIG
jgi:predicted  nucleic acid-binding Zn-ribbon protein